MEKGNLDFQSIAKKREYSKALQIKTFDPTGKSNEIVSQKWSHSISY